MKIWTKLSPPTASSSSTGRLARAQPDARMVVGYSSPAGAYAGAPPRRTMGGLFSRYPFTFAVVLPTLLVALYFFAYATPQYVSEARFTVRAPARITATDLLSSARTGMGITTEDENAVRDHLLSHDAVRALRERMDLIRVFRPPEADVISRLWWSEPSAERLLSHYRGQVRVVPDAYTGIATMTVRTYSPQDSLEMARHLIEIGERFVIGLNQRMLDETLRAAREEVERAEARLATATASMTAFRQRERALNPTRSAELAVGTIGTLEAEATRLRSELQQLQAFARPNNPQIQNLRNRIAAVEQQIQEERSRLASATDGVTEQVAGFERLQLELDFAARGLAAAMGGLEAATSAAQRQQVFLQRVVEPNLAERSLYPKPMLFTAYTFTGLALVYGLVWLLVAGVKEHAA